MQCIDSNIMTGWVAYTNSRGLMLTCTHLWAAQHRHLWPRAPRCATVGAEGWAQLPMLCLHWTACVPHICCCAAAHLSHTEDHCTCSKQRQGRIDAGQRV
jgi:hypothetical protein